MLSSYPWNDYYYILKGISQYLAQINLSTALHKNNVFKIDSGVEKDDRGWILITRYNSITFFIGHRRQGFIRKNEREYP